MIDKGTTGFITGYYTPQWDFLSDTLLQVGVGKVLAGGICAQFYTGGGRAAAGINTLLEFDLTAFIKAVEVYYVDK